MDAVVINTGTELLLGSVLNTHLNFIAREIFSFGLRVTRQITVPDGLPIREAISGALADAEIIFVTGGLGPTTDDITREITAELLGLELQQDVQVAEKITQRLKTRGFPMTDRILRQALVPAGATILPNENGTAPGLHLATKRAHLFLLPGPPRELEPMFRESVIPILRRVAGVDGTIECRTYRLTGVGESVVEAAVGKQILAFGDIELGYCARLGEVDLRLLGKSARLHEAEAIIRTAFPKAIYSTSGEKLEEVVVRMLIEAKQTVAVAESCTGGYLANRLTNVPGASAAFLAGYIAYANEAKIQTLDLDPSLLEEHGAVSREIAAAMAAGGLRKSGATHVLSTTGIAGPSGETETKPLGTVFIGLASEGAGTQVQRFRFLTDRESFKRLASQSALEMLRQRLLA